MKKLIVAAVSMMMTLSALAATQSPVAVTLVRGANSGIDDIFVAPSSIDFGIIDPNVGGLRVAAATENTAVYSAVSNQAWYVAHYFQGSTTNGDFGLSAPGTTTKVPLKLQFPAEYGQNLNLPAVWDAAKWVLAADSLDADKKFFSLVQSTTSGSGIQKFKFVTDITSALPGYNYSGTVIFELVYE
jgi:hypothetical protein